MEFLPLILFDIRVSIKDDIGHSPAELVYGITLTISGQMIAPVPPKDIPDPTIYVRRLLAQMSRFSLTQLVRRKPTHMSLRTLINGRTFFYPKR